MGYARGRLKRWSDHDGDSASAQIRQRLLGSVNPDAMEDTVSLETLGVSEFTGAACETRLHRDTNTGLTRRRGDLIE